MGQSYYSQFVNSPDIREHFDTISCECDDPLAAAWLVWQSKEAPLRKKFKAWTHIIETMPDMKISFPGWISAENNTVHSFLQSYMMLIRRFCDEFNTQEEDDVYNYYHVESNLLFDNRGLFHDLSSCLEEAMQCEDHVILYKLNLKNGVRIRAWFNRDSRITDIRPEYDLFFDEENLMEHSFLTLNMRRPFPFSFPTPFQTGDLVYDSTTERTICLTGDNILERYGSSAMNFTFCRNSEFFGIERALLYKSDYLKGGIDLDTLLRETCRIVLEEAGIQLQDWL